MIAFIHNESFGLSAISHRRPRTAFFPDPMLLYVAKMKRELVAVTILQLNGSMINRSDLSHTSNITSYMVGFISFILITPRPLLNLDADLAKMLFRPLSQSVSNPNTFIKVRYFDLSFNS